MEIKVVQKVLDVNDQMAEQNRELFSGNKLFVINVMSSPGSGKTTTLQRTLKLLGDKIKAGVIVGDICTSNDAERLSEGGAPVVQINTEPFGGDCHLAAHVIKEAALGMDLEGMDLLIIENVGNLVCPAEFDIGEHKRVVVISVTEGEDKPVKYPLMFRVCDVALINKIDLVPHLDFDLQLLIDNIKSVHPDMPIFSISARTGEGLEPWMEWLKGNIKT